MTKPERANPAPYSDEEEAAIQRGIAADPDSPELTDAFFARARPGDEVVPGLARRRGPQKAPVKQLVAMRLDRDLVAELRAGGRGWQGRVNALLRKAVLES